MKREITCGRCVEEWRRIAKNPDVVAAGERVDIVGGAARETYTCDGCNGLIGAGEHCHAVTVTTPEQRPYPRWADEAVEVRP